MDSQARSNVGAVGVNAALLVLLVSPPLLSAQTLVGTVTDGSSGRPVLGAVVRLADDPEGTTPISITLADGSYRLTAPTGGRYLLLVERIGFEPARVGPTDVPQSGSVTLDISVEAHPIRLEGLQVQADPRACASAPQDALTTQTVWDQARTALAVAAWTARSGALSFRLRSRVRELAPRSLSVVEESSSLRTVRGGNSVRSLAPDDLAEGGYVRSRADGQIDFFAPDADALLSDSFLRRHCFRVVPGTAGEDHLVGLAFDPIASLDTPDIEGTLWLHRVSSRLERMEFTYTGLERGEGAGLASGAIRFAEISDGRWIVRDWYIRAPVIRLVRNTGFSGTRSRPMVTSLIETGSEVIWARGPGVEWTPDIETHLFEGIVWDSVAGVPLRNADVRLAGRGWAAVTTDSGTFTLRDVPEGTYRVTFDYPRLDSLGAAPGWRDIVVPSDATGPVELAIPSKAAIVASACADDAGVVLGQGRDTSGEPVPGAAISLQEEPAGSRMGAITDLEGWYHICGVPASGEFMLSAVLGPFTSGTYDVPARSHHFERVDVDLNLAAEVPVDDDWPRVFGVVRDVETDLPLGNVSLSLLDPSGRPVARSMADSRGQFSLSTEEPGDYRVHADALGYAPLQSEALRLGAGAQRVEVRLATSAIEIEGVVVALERRIPYLDANGFYLRESATGGRFLRLEDIELNRPQRTTDLLRRVPSVQRLDTSRDGNSTAHRIQLATALRGAQRQTCAPAVYVDGTLARQGWARAVLPSGYPLIDDLISPPDLWGVEVYETVAEVPVRFAGPGSICGVIVFWTRH